MDGKGRRLPLHTGLGRVWSGALLAVALVFACGAGLLAQDGAQQQRPRPAAPSEPYAAAVYGVLETHCARCHQAGAVDGAATGADGGISNILALDELVRQATLIRAGEPEASALFNTIYSGHAPLGVFIGAPSGEPSAADVAAVRDWIRKLPAGAACDQRPRLGTRHAADHIERLVAEAGQGGSAHLRFISLAHLHDACASAEELASYRRGAAQVLAALSPLAHITPPEPIDPEQLVLKVDRAALGLSRMQWDDLTADYGMSRLPPAQLSAETVAALGTARGVVNGDWLAAAARSAAVVARLRPDPAEVVTRLGSDTGDVAALAGLYQGLVGTRRAAAELGYAVGELEQALGKVQGPVAAAARRLRQGAVARADALSVYGALLEGGPGSGALTGDGIAVRPTAMTLAVWLDADTHRVGQTATFNVAASDDCFLTLINVDTRGQATVLFPNEFDQDNELRGGKPVRVPADDAAYRFRLSERGRETVVGICTETPRPIDTIRHDFERLRFTVLGDWQSFQIRAYEDANKPVASPPGNRRRGVRQPEVIQAERRGLEPQARTSVTIEVK